MARNPAWISSVRTHPSHQHDRGATGGPNMLRPGLKTVRCVRTKLDREECGGWSRERILRHLRVLCGADARGHEDYGTGRGLGGVRCACGRDVHNCRGGRRRRRINSPPGLIVPTVAFPPATPFTDQVTAALLLPLTLAVSCVDALGLVPTITEAGEIDTETRAVGEEVDDCGVYVLLPQAKITAASPRMRAVRNTRFAFFSDKSPSEDRNSADHSCSRATAWRLMSGLFEQIWRICNDKRPTAQSIRRLELGVQLHTSAES